MGIQKPARPASLGKQVNASIASIMRTEISNLQALLYFYGYGGALSRACSRHQRRSDDFTESQIAQIVQELRILAVNREVEVLAPCINEDVLLGYVQPLRAGIARLSSFSIDVTNMKLACEDQQILKSLKPYSPNRVFLVISGIFLGWQILAVVIVLAKFAFLLNSIKVKPDIVALPSHGRFSSKCLSGTAKNPKKMLRT